MAVRVKWFTLGELMTGRVLDGDTKVWRNPYQKTRKLLFVYIFLHTLMTEKMIEIDWMSIPITSEFIGSLIGVGLRIYALVGIGSGKIKRLFLLMVMNIVQLLYGLFSSDYLVIFSLALITLDVVTYWVYSRKKIEVVLQE